MTCEELIKEAAKIIYQVHDEVRTRCSNLSSPGWASSPRACTKGSLMPFFKLPRSSPSPPLKRTATRTRTCLNSHKTFQLDVNIAGANPEIAHLSISEVSKCKWIVTAAPVLSCDFNPCRVYEISRPPDCAY